MLAGEHPEVGPSRQASKGTSQLSLQPQLQVVQHALPCSTVLCVCCRFWYQYSNINALVGELGIDNPFTKWTRSSFWAPDGLQVMLYLSEHAVLHLFAVTTLFDTIDFTALYDGSSLNKTVTMLRIACICALKLGPLMTHMCGPRLRDTLRDTQHNQAIYHICYMHINAKNRTQ